MDDKNNEKNVPKEREEYMRDSTDNIDKVPDKKEGLQEPRVKEMNKIKVGVAVFVVIVLIILGLGIGFDMFGLMN